MTQPLDNRTSSPTDRSVGLEELSGRIVPAILEAIPHVLAIYVYGSQLTGSIHPGSDLDIALLLPHGASPAERLLQLSGDLESQVGTPVDVSVLSLDADVVHCKEVVAHGRRIWTADVRAVDEFEMLTLSYYSRLCEDRAPVMAAYVAEPGNG